VLLAGGVTAAEYHVDRDAERKVRFVSDAPIEDFDGETDQIDGYVKWNGDTLTDTDSLLEGSEFYFEVPLATLDTHIGLRNRHMRENYLETNTYPYAHYRGRVVRVKRQADGSFHIESDGTFSIHGVDQPRLITVRATPWADTYAIAVEFEVSLTDHDIEIPKFMFLKIDEVMQLELQFTLKVAE